MDQIAEGVVELQADVEEDADGRTTAFEARARRRKGKKATPGGHELTFTVTCALALNSAPPVYGAAAEASISQGDGEVAAGRGPPGSEGPRALGYYHLEYKLFPDDPEPMRCDVINYGVAARVYPERVDSRTIKTWAGPANSEHVWVAWSQPLKLPINNETLKSLASHEITLRVWDSKEKCSSRCRWDTKPKAFRFPAPKPGQDPENVGGVKACVLRMSKSFEQLSGSKMALERPLPHHSAAPSIMRSQPASTDKAEKKETSYGLYAVPKPDRDSNTRSYSRLLRLAATEEPEPRSSGPAVPRTASRALKGTSNDMR